VNFPLLTYSVFSEKNVSLGLEIFASGEDPRCAVRTSGQYRADPSYRDCIESLTRKGTREVYANMKLHNRLLLQIHG
jgi:hypothetical protein